MQHSNISSSISHQQAWILLPWFVNGTLTAGERQLVENHLQTCNICRTEQTDLQILSAYTRHCELPELSVQASFNRLLQRIETDPTQQLKRKPFPGRIYDTFQGLTFSVSSMFSPKYSWVMATVAVLLLAVVPLGIWLMPITPDSPGVSYRTLSNARSIENSGKNDIHVIFASALSQSERLRILASVRAETIAGPNVRGVYWIRINPAQGVEVDLDKAIAALRRENGVLFAEPAVPSGASFSDSGYRP